MSTAKRTIRSSKSRGGCQSCKAKHIKCDETKPACRLCVNSGLQCPGYAKKIRWSNKHEVYARSPQTRSSATNPTSTAPRSESSGVENGRVATNSVSPDDNQLGLDGSSDTQTLYDSLSENMIQWPNLESYGYEDLGFSLPLPFPSVGMADFAPFYLTEPRFDIPAQQARDDDQTDCVVARPASKGPSSPAKLLQTFYRLSVPNEVPGFSDDDLVGHYFSHVCSLYSCFDSESNPFRSLVSKWWTECRTLRLSIESMAIAHLANFYPHMAPLGLAKRSQSWLALQQDLKQIREGRGSKDQVLLSLLLLGPSSAWHQASHLGLQYLFVARGLIQGQLKDETSEVHQVGASNDEFFLDCLLYWEMLASFVDPIPLTPFSNLREPSLLNLQHATDEELVPQAWTGVASGPIFIMAEIGRVLRRQRHLGSMSLDQQKRDHFLQQDEQWAGSLEAALWNLPALQSDNIARYNDAKTPVSDLLQIAHAYKSVALLELYAEFPALHSKSVAEGRSLEGLALLAPEGESSPLTVIAMHILSSIGSIAISSGVCRSLPLFLMSTAAQLRLYDPERRDEVIEARWFVEERLLTLSRKYPQRPMLQMVDIVKEVWQRADSGTAGAHWMTVAHERGWLTMFG